VEQQTPFKLSSVSSWLKQFPGDRTVSPHQTSLYATNIFKLPPLKRSSLSQAIERTVASRWKESSDRSFPG
jgi:hypothetical protein